MIEPNDEIIPYIIYKICVWNKSGTHETGVTKKTT